MRDKQEEPGARDDRVGRDECREGARTRRADVGFGDLSYFNRAFRRCPDEPCAVARRLDVPESEILLGANATEGKLKTFV